MALPFFWLDFPRGEGGMESAARYWALATLSVLFWLFVSIARLARHRFFSPEDIDGGAGSTTSREARVLQSILQNTLEQTVLASGVYGAWLILAPAELKLLLLFCAALYSLGRLLFIVGYSRGAVGRATGFALTFYPTVGLFLLLLGLEAARTTGIDVALSARFVDGPTGFLPLIER
ncbi:MAG: MAPEG family protein [Xanthobacteraceae bacterium]